jgi:hypothetical protein
MLAVNEYIGNELNDEVTVVPIDDILRQVRELKIIEGTVA